MATAVTLVDKTPGARDSTAWVLQVAEPIRCSRVSSSPPTPSAR